MHNRSGFVAWLVLGLSLAACAATAQENRVYRVATWNVFALPTIAGQSGQVNLDDEERGKTIARLLKNSGYDVIALNEVFDEDIRDGLVEEATSGPDAFSFVVPDIDVSGRYEDSGLVLLSRLAPVRFPAQVAIPGQHEFNPDSSNQIGYALPFPGTDRYEDTQRCAEMEVWIRGQGDVDSRTSAGCLIAVHQFRACTEEAPDGEPAGAECDSGKGVAFVRLRQPDGIPLDVFWTHMQANLGPPEYEDPPDFVGQRQRQLRELIAMIGQWSAPDRDAVVLGDTNIDGFATPLAPLEYGISLAPGGGSALGRLGFVDLWPRESSPEDWGASYSERNDHVSRPPEQRLDYLLWRSASDSDICGQHPRVERRFDWVRADGTTVDLSDHYGVGSEIRRVMRNDPCSPARARRMQKPDEDTFFGNLPIPGACQWVRIDAGTWTLTNLSAFEMRITAHPASDLSETLPYFRGEETLRGRQDHEQGESQIAADGPFYLKACWRESGRWGTYRFRVARNLGEDPEHPIVLILNRWQQGFFRAQVGSTPTTRLWALVQLPATFSGGAHSLGIDRGGHPVKLRYGTARTATDAPQWHSLFDHEATLLSAGAFGGATAQEVFVLIEREPPDDPAIEVSFTLRTTSDHHRVELAVLECVEQEDATGDDRIRMTYAADGRTVSIVDLGDFDESQDVNLASHPQLGSNWVSGPVQVSIYDQDGEDLEDDLVSGGALDHLGTITIPGFAGPSYGMPEVAGAAGRFNLDDADYRLQYTRSR